MAALTIAFEIDAFTVEAFTALFDACLALAAFDNVATGITLKATSGSQCSARLGTATCVGVITDLSVSAALAAAFVKLAATLKVVATGTLATGRALEFAATSVRRTTAGRSSLFAGHGRTTARCIVTGFAIFTTDLSRTTACVATVVLGAFAHEGVGVASRSRSAIRTADECAATSVGRRSATSGQVAAGYWCAADIIRITDIPFATAEAAALLVWTPAGALGTLAAVGAGTITFAAARIWGTADRVVTLLLAVGGRAGVALAGVAIRAAISVTREETALAFARVA